jgi:hypothetical protein
VRRALLTASGTQGRASDETGAASACASRAGALAKRASKAFLFSQRHVLVFAAAIRLGLERLDAAVVKGHVRAVHRAQRHPHPSCNRRLRHPTLTQQHHLDALALRRGYLPSQRSFQPPHLGFAAFDHLFAPNQMAQPNHTSAPNTSLPNNVWLLKNLDSGRYGAVLLSRMATIRRKIVLQRRQIPPLHRPIPGILPLSMRLKFPRFRDCQSSAS